MDALERLAALFEKFPGIGPRQAHRFVQYLLRAPAATRRELAEAVQKLGSSVHQCPECMRFHSGKTKVCGICSDASRDNTTVAVVAHDTDLAVLEKSGTYKGRYFVLGGTISLGSDTINGLRIKQLLNFIQKKADEDTALLEIILAFPANPEGDATAAHLRDLFFPMFDLRNRTCRITTLGRGLSTGSELEYADPETLRAALESRK